MNGTIVSSHPSREIFSKRRSLSSSFSLKHPPPPRAKESPPPLYTGKKIDRVSVYAEEAFRIISENELSSTGKLSRETTKVLVELQKHLKVGFLGRQND